MADRNEQGVVRPEVALLETLLEEIAEGRLRVPRFQRPFVWEPAQMLELFDSIEGGYPIGSILVWETTMTVPSLDAIAGIEVPVAPEDGTVSYLLDGHQRLSTLFGTLGRRPEAQDDDWPWRIYRRLGEASTAAGLRFVYPPDVEAPTPRLLPLQAVLRTMDFLTYARKVSRDPQTSADADELIDEAERLAQRIKSYKIAVVRLVGGSLAHAVEAFTRLNSGGKQITPQDLVSALTYRPGVDSFTDKIQAIRRNVASGGFGLLEPELVFQSIVALGETDELSAIRWADFANELSSGRAELVGRTELAIARAIQFLRYEAGVPHLTLLPYALQIPLLAAFYDRVPSPDRQQVRSLVRWFWATSWSGVLRSTTSVEYPFNLMQMRNPVGVYDLIDEGVVGHARPMPEELDQHRGRSRAYVLWELHQFSRRLDLQGKVIDAVDLYVRSGTMAYQQIMRGGGWTPANYLLMPGGDSDALADDLLGLEPRLLQDVMASHGIPAQALTYLVSGEEDAFEAIRGAYLTDAERTFMQDMGVRPAPTGYPEVDYEA